MPQSVPTVYLASGSPRRQSMLDQFGIVYSVIPNRVTSEVLRTDLTIRRAVAHLALQKAMASREHFQGIVVAADTVVVLDGTVFGKPIDFDDACRTITALQGRWHEVVSAVAVVDTRTTHATTRTNVARVKINPMSSADVENYSRRTDIYDKAGAYGIQDSLGSIVESYAGEYETILGFPWRALLRILKSYGIVGAQNSAR